MTPKFELGRDFCTMHLIAKFHHPTFNRFGRKVNYALNKFLSGARAHVYIVYQPEDGQTSCSLVGLR